MNNSNRNIVLILGNGFDLDLGLKTSYKDFWESEFCPKGYPAPLIQHLNQRWQDDLNAVKWYDLENELLNYYNCRKDKPDYPDVISPGLLEYVRSFNPYEYTCRSYYSVDEEMEELVKLGFGQYNKIQTSASIPYQEDFKHTQEWRDKKALQLIKTGLCKYLGSLAPALQARDTVSFQVLALLDKEATKGSNVSVFTFNYTPVLINNSKPDAASVHFMHGNCEDGNIIIGTRDDKEISADYLFLQKSFDTDFNPPALVEDLQKANEVIIFGHSIGENDRQYFKAFFSQQTDFAITKRKDITIFTRDYSSEIQIKRSLQSMTESNLSTLFGLNSFQIIKTGSIKKDQKKLLNFLIKHGKDELAARDFIGKRVASEAITV